MIRTIFGILAAVCVARAVEDTETIRQNYPAVARLEVRNINGSVRVTASNNGTIQLVATKRINADDQTALSLAKNEVRLDVQQSGDRLRICVVQKFEDCNESRDKTRRRRDDWEHDYDAKVDMELQVPQRLDVDVKTVNGGVTVTGTHGPFQLKTVNGAVMAKDIDGSGSAATVNGPVSLSFATEPKDAVQAKTVNGSIEAQFPKSFNASLKFKTLQGDVFTNIPATATVEDPVRAEKRNGRMVIRRNHNFGLRVNGGGPEMSFQTLTGNIQITER